MAQEVANERELCLDKKYSIYKESEKPHKEFPSLV